MKFNLKNDNYSDFGIYKKNVLFPRSYFISFSTPEEMAKTEIIKYNDCDNNRLRFYPTGFCSLPLPLRSVGNRYIRSVTNCGNIDMISRSIFI